MKDYQFLEARAHLAAIIDSSDDAIISKSLDGIIASWNPAAEKIFGYTAEEAIGQHIHLLIPQDRLDEEYIILGKVRAGERVGHFETIRRRKNGDLINVSLTVSPIKDSSGTIIGASKIARDVTQQKMMERNLRETAKRKDEFLANISHELRTPMNAIIGLANIIRMSEGLDEKERSYVSTLIQSADDLMILINDLLDFSKMESGMLILEQKEFNLTETIEKVTNLLDVKAREKGLDLLVSYQPPLNQFYIGDAFRLQQILTNLIGNAIKFTHRGSVEVNIKGGSSAESKQTVTFEVIDTGVGISEEKLDLIFEKFTQADASTTRKFGGSGLGLSIAKAFAEGMGGGITAKSRQGLGSTFTVTLPLKTSEKQEAVEPSAPPVRKAKKNVLVVEDYQPNIMVVTAFLDRFGYDYDVAQGGAEAVQFYREGEYDSILMDIQMEEMDGLESSVRIRAVESEKSRTRTPIIAMTAHVQEKDRHKCLEAGMDDFIAKPFSPDVLAQKLKTLIG